MSTEIKSLKPMQRVKVLSGPKDSPHPLNHQIGVVQGVGRVKKGTTGEVTYKSYNVSFGHASVREVEAQFLWPVD